AWAVTSVRSTSATWKYWIWVATSINFVVPLAGFYNGFAASRVSWATQLGSFADVGVGISRSASAGWLLLGGWVCGAALMCARLLVRLQRERLSVCGAPTRNATPLRQRLMTYGVPVTFSSGQGPSVGGLLRPRISLPLGVDRLLNEGELDAVLIH